MSFELNRGFVLGYVAESFRMVLVRVSGLESLSLVDDLNRFAHQLAARDLHLGCACAFAGQLQLDGVLGGASFEDSVRTNHGRSPAASVERFIVDMNLEFDHPCGCLERANDDDFEYQHSSIVARASVDLFGPAFDGALRLF